MSAREVTEITYIYGGGDCLVIGTTVAVVVMNQGNEPGEWAD